MRDSELIWVFVHRVQEVLWVIVERIRWLGVCMLGVDNFQMKVGQDGAHMSFINVTPRILVRIK